MEAFMEHALLLGVSRQKITPKVGGHLYGYTPDVLSDSVHDDLTLTAFYFAYGDTRALMISATVCLIKTEICEEIAALIEKTYGIPKECVILHATHTHSGPNLVGTVGWGDLDRAYYEEIFLPAICEVVEVAIQKAIPVKMGIASAESHVGVNRREMSPQGRIILGQNPDGPFDPKMVVIAFRDLCGSPVANIVHYGMHGTCAGINHEISRDWSGVMIDELERVSGGVTAFFNGAEGDVGPRLGNGKTTGDISYVEQQGASAAEDAIRIYRSIASYEHVSLSFAVGTVEVPLDSRVDPETARREYEKYKMEQRNLGAQKSHYYRMQLRLYEEGYCDQAMHVLPQALLRIGSAVFVTFPYEIFSEISMGIAHGSDAPYVLSLSDTNGSEGYFVTEDQIAYGGYEVDMFKTGHIQPYADNADRHLIAATLENLKQLKKKGE